MLDERTPVTYPDATEDENGNIYVLYEDKAGETDHLAVFNYEWLEEGEA